MKIEQFIVLSHIQNVAKNKKKAIQAKMKTFIHFSFFDVNKIINNTSNYLLRIIKNLLYLANFFPCIFNFEKNLQISIIFFQCNFSQKRST